MGRLREVKYDAGREILILGERPKSKCHFHCLAVVPGGRSSLLCLPVLGFCQTHRIM